MLRRPTGRTGCASPGATALHNACPPTHLANSARSLRASQSDVCTRLIGHLKTAERWAGRQAGRLAHKSQASDGEHWGAQPSSCTRAGRRTRRHAGDAGQWDRQPRKGRLAAGQVGVCGASGRVRGQCPSSLCPSSLCSDGRISPTHGRLASLRQHASPPTDSGQAGPQQ